MRDGAYNPNLVVGYVCIIWKRVIFENSSVKYSWCVRRYYSDYIIFGCEICVLWVNGLVARKSTNLKNI